MTRKTSAWEPACGYLAADDTKVDTDLNRAKRFSDAVVIASS
jgi:hypothetical protein